MSHRIVDGTDGSPAVGHAVDVAGGPGRSSGAQALAAWPHRSVRAAASAGICESGGITVPVSSGDDRVVAADEVVRRAGERLETTGISVTQAARLGEPADALIGLEPTF